MLTQWHHTVPRKKWLRKHTAMTNSNVHQFKQNLKYTETSISVLSAQFRQNQLTRPRGSQLPRSAVPDQFPTDLLAEIFYLTERVDKQAQIFPNKDRALIKGLGIEKETWC